LRRSPGRHSTPHVQRKGRSAPRSSTPGSVVYLTTIYLGGRFDPGDLEWWGACYPEEKARS